MNPLIQISNTLAKRTGRLRFSPPVVHVYNPLLYARAPHEQYLSRFGSGQKRAVLVGMNPGPFGMMQTGVPFGDVAMVRDFLGIEAEVVAPKQQHPNRPILGFACERREVSGTRLWGFVRDRFTSPERFFERFFVANYCPLVFLEAQGRNRTPDKLPATEKRALYASCDDALRKSVLALEATIVIGIGAFAHGRIKAALKGVDVTIGTILHPSPASPAANRGWARQAEKQLIDLGVL
jgi:single-strand selective monofunctional uracil DNA glycosylase